MKRKVPNSFNTVRNRYARKACFTESMDANFYNAVRNNHIRQSRASRKRRKSNDLDAAAESQIRQLFTIGKSLSTYAFNTVTE